MVDISHEISRLVVEESIRRAYYRISRDLSNAIATAARSGTVGAMGGVRNWGKLVERDMGNPTDLQRAHEQIADNMRREVIREFNEKFPHKNYYREGGEGGTTTGGFLTRYSGGSLERAISHPDLVKATATGIDFVDEGRLTKEAAHWAKMNFGAHGTEYSNREVTPFPVLFDGRKVAEFKFNVGLRPAFDMPTGIWKRGDSWVAAGPPTRGDQFFPHRRFFRNDRDGNKRWPTRGIKGREFLDAGLRVLAHDIPASYETLLDKWMNMSNIK